MTTTQEIINDFSSLPFSKITIYLDEHGNTISHKESTFALTIERTPNKREKW